MFEIGFSYRKADLVILTSSKEAAGFIKIGTFRETIFLPLTYWSKERYLRQWEDGIQRLISGQQRRSALIESITGPKPTYLFWWLLYRRGNTVIFRNHMLILEQLHNPFDINNPYASIPRYAGTTDEGNKVSEWRLSFAEFRRYRISP